MDENRQIELRSEKVRNIIGQVPPVLLRYGNSIIALSLLILVVVALIIPYQPSLDIEIDITQNSSGEIQYTANIPEEDLEKKSMFEYITASSTSELLLPNRFHIQNISDTAIISNSCVWYKANLLPIEESFKPIILLEEQLILPAEIVLQKKSLLHWVVGKVWVIR